MVIWNNNNYHSMVRGCKIFYTVYGKMDVVAAVVVVTVSLCQSVDISKAAAAEAATAGMQMSMSNK